MKIPLSWLKTFIDLEASAQQIGQMLTSLGLEVDGIETVSPPFEGVVIGLITSVEKHPDAEKLLVAQVSDGDKTWQVVCGAHNCRAASKVPFARIGAVIGGKKLKATKLRGVESFGMLCSGKELGITEDDEGLLEFDAHLKEGVDVAGLYSETVLDISLTPNLGHAASILGVARELSTLAAKPVRLPDSTVSEEGEPIQNAVLVEVEEPELCPRYGCRVIRGVSTGQSPEWMQKRLEASGMRPINLVVDVTNYVQMELGHPLHAFDLTALAGGKIIVRRAREEESFMTLDGKNRTLKSEDLVIADRDKPVALAGVMGGVDAEVGPATVDILLEAAYFLPQTVRKTSKRLQLQTESSRRFERGVDPNQIPKALDRAAHLLLSLSGAILCKGSIDEKREAFVPKKIPCRLSRICRVLGVTFSVDEIEKMFVRLEMIVEWNGGDSFTVAVPTYRGDISREIDLIEEVARLWGYDNFPKNKHVFSSSALSDSPLFLFEKLVKKEALALGLQEFLTCDLIGPSLLKVLAEPSEGAMSPVYVLNPTSVEQSILRTSLFPGLLQVVKHNIDHQKKDIAGFEIGRIHYKDKERYGENLMIALCMSGKSAPAHWDRKPKSFDFYDLKGKLEELFDALGIGPLSFEKSENSLLHPGRQASVSLNGIEVGLMGEVHPSIQTRLDVDQSILFAEIDLHPVFERRQLQHLMSPLPLYPASDRDWTVTLSKEKQVNDIIAMIYSVSSNLLESVEVADVYEDSRLGEGARNVTFHFVYRDRKKTVSQEAVEKEHGRIIASCQKKLEGEKV